MKHLITKFLSSIALLTLSVSAYAGYEWEYKPTPTVTYTLTLDPCVDLANPEALDLRYAYAFDGSTGETMRGCSMLNGEVVELQFINPEKKKHFQIRIPTQLFKVKESI